MTKASFYLPIEPFSVNRMHSRDRRFKTQDYKDWELAFISALANKHPQEQLQKLREAFDASKHGFVVKLNFQYPATILFNKQGLISSRAEDLSNVEKPLVDLLFLPKVHVQSFPWGCPNVNADDKHILRLTSSKSSSPDEKHYIHISIALVELKKPTRPANP